MNQTEIENEIYRLERALTMGIAAPFVAAEYRKRMAALKSQLEDFETDNAKPKQREDS